MRDYVFTSESVSEGHPDKICDQISDAILDVYLTHDPYARVAVETLATTNRVILAGEVRGPQAITSDLIETTVRNVVKSIGYEQDGFHWDKLIIDNYLHAQSVDIAQGVDATSTKEEGAGDQGIMFGYACRETEELMPAPVAYAHKLLYSLARDRHCGILKGLGPDAKSQISLRYVEGVPVEATAIVLSTQHAEGLTQGDVIDLVTPYIYATLPPHFMTNKTMLHINPSGRFVIGGPDGDTGLTGRKIIVDTYGGAAPHGGGAFSGKDPTKVDRSAAYASRYLAKNVVGAGLADKCTIQLSYAIGMAEPTSLYVNTHGTGHVDEGRLSDVLRQAISLTPRGIREHLGLNRPIYENTAAYGHFGRAPDADGRFSWEKLDLVGSLRAEFL